jgi:hypothetical protein
MFLAPYQAPIPAEVTAESDVLKRMGERWTNRDKQTPFWKKGYQ